MSNEAQILEAWREWAKADRDPDLNCELDWARERALDRWDTALTKLEALDPVAAELKLRENP